MTKDEILNEIERLSNERKILFQANEENWRAVHIERSLSRKEALQNMIKNGKRLQEIFRRQNELYRQLSKLI